MSDRDDIAPVGMRVRLRAPDAWYDGLTGVVICMARSHPAMYEIQPDDPRQPKALVYLEDMRVIP